LSDLSSVEFTNHISSAEKLSTHLFHFLVSKFTLYLINDNTNGMNVISEYLKIAIVIAISAIIIAGIAAISVQIVSASPENIEYAIHNHTIIIDNCLKLNPNNIGSSFSI